MKKRSAIQETSKDRFFLTIIMILSLLILIIEVYPLVYVLSASLSSSDAISLGKVYLWPVELSLKGYEMVMEEKEILTGFKNSLIYMGVGTTLNMFLTILLSYPLSRKELPMRNTLTVFVIVTMYIQGGLIPTYLLVNSMGFVDTIWGLILPGAISTTNMIIMRTYFSTSIPESLHEAAVLDGCNYTRYLVRIILPLSMPIIAVIGLYYGVGHWNSYFDALIYLRSSEKQNLQLVLRSILLANQVNSGDGGYSEAAKLSVTIKYSVIVVSCIPMMVAYPFVQKFFVKGVMIGALKG